MEGIHASVAALQALFVKDASLETAAAAAAGVDVLQRKYELRLDRLGAVARLEAQLAALKARDAAEAVDIQHAMTPPEAPVHERTYAEMSAVEEIAGVLTISAPAAGAFVTQSRQLCSLPLELALDALSDGAISWQHAKIIADETDNLGPAGAANLVAHFLDPDSPNPARGAAAGKLVPSRFRTKVRGWCERHHPESLEKRHTKSVADRRMECTPDRDGMAWLSLYLPADTADAIWDRTTALARGIQGPQEARTMAQLRPDIAAHLLLSAGPGLSHAAGNSAGQSNEAEGTTETTDDGSDGPIGRASLTAADANDDTTATAFSGLADVPVPNAQVLVTVPVFSLLGLTDEPANLDGYGPIPASMARKLLADGANSFYRVLVDPRDGSPLEIGRTSYRLTKAMEQALRLRDGKCTFPGCNNRTMDNEADHLKAWQHGGNTGISNLAQLCPKHHRLKHNSGWEPTKATRTEPPGWISPTGRHYKSEHPDWEPPQWPPGSLAGATEPPWLLLAEPPPEEPVHDNLVDPADLPADDSLWDDFYAMPNVLPADPLTARDLLRF
ncbi:HNH endonuclease signature motif containing protein [Arthrobacter sp. Z1-9]